MTSALQDEMFAVMARAAYGERSARVALPPDADLEDPVVRNAFALNVLLSDLELRQEEARRATEEALAERTARLRGAEAAVGLRDEFIAVAAHELNTPLASMRLAVSALTGALGDSSPEVAQRALRLVDRQARVLGTLIERLLSSSRVQAAGPPVLHLADVDLAALVQELAEQLTGEAARAGCELRVGAGTPVVGRWDPDRLQQVVRNLLSNAIKFGRGRPVEITVMQASGWGRLEVRDQGIGIGAAVLPTIFERFVRGVSARQYGGLGLGLFVVRELVEAHGGTVRAESTERAGATFVVELPVAGPGGAAAPEPPPAAPAP